MPRNCYLVKRRAVSWWNWWCCTNLQNLDSICEADTPKHEKWIHLNSSHLLFTVPNALFTKCKWFSFWSCQPFQMSKKFWQAHYCDKISNGHLHNSIWNELDSLMVLLDLARLILIQVKKDRHLNINRNSFSICWCIAFNAKVLHFVFKFETKLNRQCDFLLSIPTNVIWFEVQIVSQEENMNNGYIYRIANAGIRVYIRYDWHQC